MEKYRKMALEILEISNISGDYIAEDFLGNIFLFNNIIYSIEAKEWALQKHINGEIVTTLYIKDVYRVGIYRKHNNNISLDWLKTF